ncbi:hypothetical protein J3R82DRAFT_2696 [Butyriboletus roseoflavus]|nr:hypothetical protein J3R82DRAFT_2696 [Butyriboletus roseoflavus]
MAFCHRTAASLWALLAFLVYIGFATAQEPEVSVSHFDNLPGRLFFFEDTSSVVYHDIVTGDLYVSQDEGKSWSRAEDIPGGIVSMVIPHPFDNRYAFALTDGMTHYRTENRGKTWRSFEVLAPLSYTPKPLSFHSDKWDHILYQGTICEQVSWNNVCTDVTYYTTDGFSSTPEVLLKDTSSCQFAHSSKDFKHSAHENLIYCVAYDSSSVGTSHHTLSSSRLYSSPDFFQTVDIEDLGIGKNAKGVIAFAVVSKFAVVALKDVISGNDGDMQLYVTVDTKEWARAQFPHASQARLRQNAYTIVESTIHSLAVDVMLQDQSTIGTLFVSNSNGTYFVESLKDTNRNMGGYVDYENVQGVAGVGIANVVMNALDVERKSAQKKLRSMITFDDGSSWSAIRAPSSDSDGKQISCDPSNLDECSLHLHSVTDPHNFGPIFSSTAPGLVMGVGSIGKQLSPYEECDTFLSTDAGLSWRMVQRQAHMYEFGDTGSIILAVNDEEMTDTVNYSTDFGRTWKSFTLGVSVRAKALTTVSDATSQKFILLGQLSRKDQREGDGRYAVIHLDFAGVLPRKCGDDDYEKWYARAKPDTECLMGVKQWYNRRKADVDCYVGDKFHLPAVYGEPCICQDHDYECDYNYVRSGDECVPAGLERIPSTQCTTGNPDEKYTGSSGYRLIAGNMCDSGESKKKDDPVEKSCSQAEPQEGEVTNQIHQFNAKVLQYQFFRESSTILVFLDDKTVWQSSNEGFTWEQRSPGEHFLGFYMHPYSNERAYLITESSKYVYTTDGGRFWHEHNAPSPPNTFGAPALRFQPRSDLLIWIGNVECDGSAENCHAQAQYSRDHGRKWQFIEDYVVNCDWARDDELLVDSSQILCESYEDKQHSQRSFGKDNALQLISGRDYYGKKTKLFEHVVGFTKFSEYLIVAEYLPTKDSLDLQVSLDGLTFATGKFPPGMHPNTHAYTVLESSTDSIFLHMTMSEWPNPFWGNILKSNSNGTYFGLSIANVNRNEVGYVDFDKFAGLDGIALVNIVANPVEAIISGRKVLQTRITHNDGGTWKPLAPPNVDSHGKPYPCSTTSCALHVHGFTERRDARATYSSPSVVGVVMAVGNVGDALAPYTESDTFLSRDGGFIWEEVHKDAHLWEFGDSGSIILIVNDEEPTDHVLFTTDEGLSWREYKFSHEKLRISTIITVPEDTSRKFMLLGYALGSRTSTIIQIDFTSLTHRKCILNEDDPAHDDFELWSPSEGRAEPCLFGRQTLYTRRKRKAECIVGKEVKTVPDIVRNCACGEDDFECEFNFVKNDEGICMPVPGTSPLVNDDSCRSDEEYWYDRTAYRKVTHSSCEGGQRLDHGTQHLCPGIRGHGVMFWIMVLIFPFAFTALIALWWYKKSGLARGTIRLPGDYSGGYMRSGSGVLDTLASVPWFLVGLAGIAYEYVSSRLDILVMGYRSRRGYRDLPVDEDAQILRFEDEEE